MYSKTVVLCVTLALSGICIQAQNLSKFQKWQHPSFFRGYNMGVWNNEEDRPVSQQDFTELKGIGANLVVIQTQGSLLDSVPYSPHIYYTDGIDTILYVDMLDSMVSYARNAGLMYVLSVRSGPGRRDVADEPPLPPSTVWTNPNEQILYGGMLKEMAERYLPDTLFVAMDLTQEPNPYGEAAYEAAVSALDSAMKADGIDINALYRLWIDSVRTIAPDLPLCVQGIHWSNPEYFSLVTKQADPQINYKVHMYNPAEYSHADPVLSVTYPASYYSVALDNTAFFDRTFMKNQLYRPVRDFQTAHDVPVLIGEFGLQWHQNGGPQYLSDIGGIACELGWHFALWIFNDGPSFNYRTFDRTHGTRYWDRVLQLMQCRTTSTDLIPARSTLSVQAWPNPASSTVTISVTPGRPGVISLRLYDILGRLVSPPISENPYVTEEFHMKLAVDGLVPGLYSLVVQSENAAIHKSILVSHN